MKIITLFLLFLSSSCAFATIGYEPTNQIEPFSTDGCSVSPEGTPSDKSAWVHCCITHDIAYWVGGKSSERLKADKDLQACITEEGFSTIGTLYYIAVRKGGSPWGYAPWRWGYGWPYNHGYRNLNEAQRESVEEESQFIERVIQEYLDLHHPSVQID